MSEARFKRLERALIRHGVAARHARRAALELGSHFQELRRDALERGESPEQAARTAHQAMGSDATLITRYAGQRELRGWLYRWPVLYAFAPVVSFALLCITSMALLVLSLDELHAMLRSIAVPAWVAAAVNSSIAVALLWVLPVLVAAAFAFLASRRPVEPRWLIASALLVCLTARLMNAGLMLPFAGHRGSASLGIGFSFSALPQQLTYALITAALALVPYFLTSHRLRRGSSPST